MALSKWVARAILGSLLLAAACLYWMDPPPARETTTAFQDGDHGIVGLEHTRTQAAAKHHQLPIGSRSWPVIAANLSELAFAIPTVPRGGNHTYLSETVRSLLRFGVNASQIHVMNAALAGESDHVEFTALLAEIPIVQISASTQEIDIKYELSTQQDAGATFAAKDTDDRKRWRIKEVKRSHCRHCYTCCTICSLAIPSHAAAAGR